MEAIVAPGATFEHAHELPSSTVRPVTKSVGNKGGNNGAHGGKGDSWRCGDSAWEKSKVFADEKKDDLVTTQANKRILVVNTAQGTRKFVKLSEYR